MNIELQCCALFVLLTILVMFQREKKLDLMNRRLFQCAMYACFACIIFDILSVVLINQSTLEGFSPFITKIVCKAYIILLGAQGFFAYLYVSTNLLPREKTWAKIVRTAYHVVFGIGCSLMIILPIDFYCEGRVVYSFGPSTIAAYILSGIYIFSTVIFTLVYRKKMPGRRFAAMLIWQAIWFIAAVIQYFIPELLLVGFASSFGMVILYIQLENPSDYIDASTGLFTSNALSVYVHDKYKYHKQFSMFTAKIHYLTNNVDYNMEQTAVMRTAHALVNLGPEPAFRIDDDTFCIVYDDTDRMLEMAAEIKRQKDSVKTIPAKGTYLLIPDSMIVNGPDEFFRFLHVYLENEQEITIADEELVEKLREQNSTKELINEALQDDRVEVFYQPIYSVVEKRFTAAEALVRIRDKEGKIVPPGKFITVAEENGQIIPLGIRVFDKVCRLLSKKEVQKFGLKHMEVNVSAAQFDHENPAKFIIEHLDKYQLNPDLINVEITETAASENQKIMLDNMNKLIENGVTFSLDDFGTGRSNIDYFVNLPVNIVKFDYSFTRGFFENEKIKPVLVGMVGIIHKMNMRVVVEGIETKEQLEVMIGMGVDFIQGYYFSKPIPESDFVEFLIQNNKED